MQFLKYFIGFIVVLVFAACETTGYEVEPIETKSELFVAGYLPWYGYNNFDFDALEYIDRLYYFSIAPTPEGAFVMEEKHKTYIEDLKLLTEGTNCELFLVIGGWYESETIFPMAANAKKREAYTDSVVQFCLDNRLTGVDLDWEAYPTKVPEGDYLALVQTMSEKLKENELKFTVAVAASQQNLSAKFKNYADQINIMSYGVLDEQGKQVPMNMLKGWLQNFEAAGVPRSKLIVGVPFYGKRPYNANDNSARAITYASIVANSSPDYSTNTHGKYAFNGRGLMQTKTAYLREMGYFGVMSWELSQDVAYNSEYSLLQSIVSTAKN